MFPLSTYRCLAEQYRNTPVYPILISSALVRHSAVWIMCGCNPNTLPLHVAMLKYVYR
jgi:hypothetical protein